MSRLREKLPRLIIYGIGVAYFSLTVWMHIWALEAGLPLPGEPKKPHHQVCTWIGTSGEAVSLDGSTLILPTSISSVTPVVKDRYPILPIISDSIRARAPPFLA